MQTIVENIERTEAPEDFLVHFLVDGARKSFRLRVRLPDLAAITPLDLEYIETFACTTAGRQIARLVVAAYKGEEMEFPIKLAP